MRDFLALEKTFGFNVYPKRDVVLMSGKNALVWDDADNEYVDCVSGHGVSNLGHANEEIVSAIRTQSEKLITCSNVFYNDQRALLLEKLIGISPESMKRAFICNSGTEAIEAAIKFARFTTKKTDFISTIGGFHGRTMGALSATYKPEYRTAFEPLVPGFSFVPFNNFDKIKEAIGENTAGIILEVVQGEGGINVAEAEYLQRLSRLCAETGVLLIVDEVQSGFGRTGKMFACNHFNLQPDILCLAKAIAGGLPMGAVVCSDRIEVPAGKHGTTFGGNPLSCAAGIAVIDYTLEHNLDLEARDKGDHFRKQVRADELSKVREVRGLGLMIGIELHEKAPPYVLQLLDEGVLVFPAGANVLRVFPPLTIEYPVWDRVIDKIVRVLK